jgi:CRP-like cAMP-binding protein
MERARFSTLHSDSRLDKRMSMAISRSTTTPSGNKLLDRLRRQEYHRLVPHIQLVPLDFKQVLFEPRTSLDYAYFPREGVASMITLMEDGRGIEVATIGREGMIGLSTLLGGEKSIARFIVQIPGNALRMKAGVLKEETSRDTPLRRLLFLYNTAFLKQITQSVACNGLHSLRQRCCRWLLMSRDRMDTDELPLTHELLADMLGVRRSSVSEVLEPLQQKGLIHYHRGKLKILDYKGLEAVACECYRRVKEEFDRLFG